MKTLIPRTLCIAATVTLMGSELPAASVCFEPVDPADGRREWAFEVGVAFITDSTINGLARGDFGRARGAAGGEIYSLTAARRLGGLRIGLGDHVFHPEVELPFTLELVDENGRSPFYDLNAGVVLRWTEFPWNPYLRTSFATGVGLSYSERVYQVDIDRHRGEDRSRLKFHWPIQLTFSLPAHPDQQLTLFISHQSGGAIFDRGGVNSIGMGYRRGF